MIKKLFLININKFISNDFYMNLIVWNIDYHNNSLIKLIYADIELFRGNTSFGYFYIISFEDFIIIDENYHCVYYGMNKSREKHNLESL